MISPDCRLSRKKSVPWRIIDEEAVLIDIDKGEVFQLNDVGALIWQTMDGNITVNGLINEVCARFDVDRDKASLDVFEFIDELCRRGAVSY